jgi:tetratricopeptide (TPR) repeat protein
MRLVARSAIAILASAVASAGAWYACRYLGRLDAATCWGITGVVATVVVSVAAAWAVREPVRLGAPRRDAAASLGDRSLAATGDTGLIITGDVRDTTFHITSPGEHRLLVPAASPPGGPVITGDVPQQPTAFQPRSTALDPLREPGPRVSVIYAVTGMRGTGKTQIAAAVARKAINDSWRLVAWIDASTTATSLDGLAATAQAAGIVAGDGQLAAALALRRWLEADGRQCLVVFDNADNPDSLRRFLPAAGQAHVLITSTSQAMTGLGIPVPVDVFSKAEALAYLAHRTGLHDEPITAELADEMGYLPLALAQAAAMITSQHLTYPDYLRRLRTFPIADYLIRPAEDPYPHATAAVILLALQSACDTDPLGIAAPLMDLLAVLASAGAPRSLLHMATTTGVFSPRGQAVTPDAVDAALGHLARASLLTFSLDQATISAHRLTTRTLREQHQHAGTLTAVGAAAVAVLDAATDASEPIWQHAPAARDLVQQITALQGHLIPALDGDPDGITADLLRLRGWAQRCLDELAESPTEAIQLGKALVTDRERVQGADHPDTLTSRNNLAGAYQAAGRVAEAIPLYERTRDDCNRVLGADHPDTLRSRNNLAGAYLAAGRLAEAIPRYEHTLDDRNRVLGADHPDTLRSRGNLAFAYLAAGRVAEAIPLYERTRDDCNQVLDADHPDTLRCRGNLAFAYLAAGRLAEAIPLYERTRDDCNRVLGADHPDTLRCRGSLAFAYLAAGRVAEAIPLCERALDDCNRVLGTDHPDTLRCRGNLGYGYQMAGRLAEAIPLYERTRDDRERVLGAEHSDTLAARNNLAGAYQAAGRVAEAIPLYEHTRDDFVRVLGADHPDTLRCRGNLASAYLAAGRVAEAIPLYEHTLDDCNRVLGADHPDTLRCRGNLAIAYRPRAARMAKPLARLQRALAEYEQRLGPNHPQAAAARRLLAALQTGRPERARGRRR